MRPILSLGRGVYAESRAQKIRQQGDCSAAAVPAGIRFAVASGACNCGFPEMQASGIEAKHCPDHPSKDSKADKGSRAATSTSAPSSHHGPAPKHDCCSSLGCLCHCAQSPGVLNLSLASVVLSSPCLLPFVD